MDTLSLDVSHRIIQRKKVSALRKEGITPLHLYGRGISSSSLQAKSSDVSRIVNLAGHNIPVTISLSASNEQSLAFVGEVQYDPSSDEILHVDFLRVDTNQPMKRDVPISLTGESPGVRMNRGVLSQGIQFLSVECLPLETPERIEIDISVLEEIDSSIRVKDYSPPSGIKVLSDAEDLIARVSAPRAARTARGSDADDGSVDLSGEAVPATETEAPQE